MWPFPGSWGSDSCGLQPRHGSVFGKVARVTARPPAVVGQLLVLAHSSSFLDVGSMTASSAWGCDEAAGTVTGHQRGVAGVAAGA